MEKNILFTLRYFDLFDYPLNFEELVKWLFVNSKNTRIQEYKNRYGENGLWRVKMREQIKDDLYDLIDELRVEESAGYYFLPGRSEVIEVRRQRERLSSKKIKKARKTARWLALAPGVKMIAIASNLGYLNADKDADIDLFVVTEKGKIWRARFWMALTMKMLNKRPTKKKTKDKICLSYFVTEDNLNLEKTKAAEGDAHLVYLLSQYLPLWVCEETQKGRQIDTKMDTWGRFIKQNRWINEYLPLFEYGGEERKYLVTSVSQRRTKMARVPFGFVSEKWAKKIQLKILPEHLREARDRDDKSVIMNDGMLKLHSNDKRGFYNRRIKEFFPN